jgi:hypothetical protein
MSAIPKFNPDEMIWSIDGDIMKWLRISSTEIVKGRVFYTLIKKRATESNNNVITIKKPQHECFKNLDSLIDYDAKNNLK